MAPLAAQVATGVRSDVAKAAERLADVASAVREHPADAPVERMQAKVESRRNAEVPTAAAERPEQLLVLGSGLNHRTVGRDELSSEHVLYGQPVLRCDV